jgi:holo-[acyl-carrier protein] synthase
MKVGIDIVHIPRIEALLRDAAQTAAVFSQEEMVGDVKTMAGRFAAKEAYRKAAGRAIEWTSIQVLKKADGAPYLVCPEEERVRLSISHDGEYAVAIVIIE